MSSSNSGNSGKGTSGNSGKGTSGNSGKGESGSGNFLDKFMSFFSSGNLIAIIFIIVVLFFILIILWIIFSIRNKDLSNAEFLKSPIKLDALDSPFEVPNSDMPKPTVGREYTYSFWLYVDKLSQNTVKGLDKNGLPVDIPRDLLVFYRGSTDGVASANPLVFMDGQTNKLYIAIKTQDSQLAANITTTLGTAEEKERFKNTYDANVNLAAARTNNQFLNKSLGDKNHTNKHMILTIDYIPLQRWVNVTCVIDNKICTIFMDGEIYSVKSTEEYSKRSGNLIVDKTDGNVFVGKNIKVSNGATPDSYFSRLRFFNYGITMNEVKKIYNDGPAGGSMFGLPGMAYGVRSPIYKVGT